MLHAKQLAREIYASVPLFPRSLFLSTADINIIDKIQGTYQGTYQGKVVKVMRALWAPIEVSYWRAPLRYTVMLMSR